MKRIAIYDRFGEIKETVTGVMVRGYLIPSGDFYLATVKCDNGRTISQCYIKPEENISTALAAE